MIGIDRQRISPPGGGGGVGPGEITTSIGFGGRTDISSFRVADHDQPGPAAHARCTSPKCGTSGRPQLFKECGLRFHDRHQRRDDVDDPAAELAEGRRLNRQAIGRCRWPADGPRPATGPSGDQDRRRPGSSAANGFVESSGVVHHGRIVTHEAAPREGSRHNSPVKLSRSAPTAVTAGVDRLLRRGLLSPIERSGIVAGPLLSHWGGGVRSVPLRISRFTVESVPRCAACVACCGVRWP